MNAAAVALSLEPCACIMSAAPGVWNGRSAENAAAESVVLTRRPKEFEHRDEGRILIDEPSRIFRHRPLEGACAEVGDGAGRGMQKGMHSARDAQRQSRTRDGCSTCRLNSSSPVTMAPRTVPYRPGGTNRLPR